MQPRGGAFKIEFGMFRSGSDAGTRNRTPYRLASRWTRGLCHQAPWNLIHRVRCSVLELNVLVQSKLSLHATVLELG